MRKKILVSALVAATLPTITAAPAPAADPVMTLLGCGTPEQPTGPAAGWTAEAPVGSFSESVVACSSAGTMSANNGASKFASSGYAFRNGEGAALSFTAPAGRSISRVLIDAAASASSRNNDADYGAMEMFPSVRGDIAGVLDVCKAVPGFGCFGGPSGFGATMHDGISQYVDLAEGAIRIDVRCGNDTRCNALGSEPIGITVDRTEIDLVESPPAAPAVSAVGGSLVTDAVLTGTETLTFTATDNAAGVYRAIVSKGGKEVAVPLEGAPAACADVRPGLGTAYEFASPSPCPTSGTFAARVDTSQLPEGPGALAVAVEDATGMRGTAVASRDVRVDNAPSSDDPPSGGSTSTGGGGGGGTSTSTPGGTATTSSAPGDPTNGTNASNRARFVLKGRRTRTLRFGRRLPATVTLRDELGRPISGAKVTVLQRLTRPGARFKPVRSPLTTDAKGRLRWTIPAGASRTIRFAYKANLANADFQATTDLVLRVRSKTSFETDRARLRNGQTVRFSGRLRSLPAPKAGVVVEIQARVGRKWQTFRTTRTSKAGRWKAAYRFRSTSGLQRYDFRVRIKGDSGFPYLPSTTGSRTVTVRG